MAMWSPSTFSSWYRRPLEDCVREWEWNLWSYVDELFYECSIPKILCSYAHLPLSRATSLRCNSRKLSCIVATKLGIKNEKKWCGLVWTVGSGFYSLSIRRMVVSGEKWWAENRTKQWYCLAIRFLLLPFLLPPYLNLWLNLSCHR